MRYRWLILSTLIVAVGAHAQTSSELASKAPQLSPFEARYEVRRNGKTIGEATLALELVDETRIKYHMRTKGTRGLARWLAVRLEETSEAEWHDGRWRPVSYVYRERMRMRKRDRHAEFDWDAGQATGSNKGNEWVADIHAGVVDSRLLELMLAHDVYAGVKASELKYEVLRKGRIRPYSFRRRTKETLTGPTGEPLSAQVLERIDDRRDRQVRLWLSDDLGHAPLRARYEDDDESLELKLIDFRNTDVAVASKL